MPTYAAIERICDRRSARAELEAQHQVLKLKLATLQTPTIQPIQPEPSYAVELAKIDASRSQIQSLTAQIQQFESGSVYTPLAWSVLPLQEQRQQLFTLKQKSDTPGKAGGLMSVTVPGTGAFRGADY